MKLVFIQKAMLYPWRWSLVWSEIDHIVFHSESKAICFGMEQDLSQDQLACCQSKNKVVGLNMEACFVSDWLTRFPLENLFFPEKQGYRHGCGARFRLKSIELFH